MFKFRKFVNKRNLTILNFIVEKIENRDVKFVIFDIDIWNITIFFDDDVV